MSWVRYNQNTKRKVIDTKRKVIDINRNDTNSIELNIDITDSNKPKAAFGKQFIDYIDAILYINLELFLRIAQYLKFLLYQID